MRKQSESNRKEPEQRKTHTGDKPTAWGTLKRRAILSYGVVKTLERIHNLLEWLVEILEQTL